MMDISRGTSLVVDIRLIDLQRGNGVGSFRRGNDSNEFLNYGRPLADIWDAHFLDGGGFVMRRMEFT